MTNDNKSESNILRQKAEDLLKKKLSKTASPLSEIEMLKLIQELEIHQIELELQNEELNYARTVTERAKNKYTNLYDFAPNGYFTLSKLGDIIELNLTGSKMLNKVRSKLINRQFSLFVSTDTRSVFNLFLDKVFQSKNNETCEVTLSKDGNFLTHVLLTGIVAENGEECLVTMIDITKQKQTEEDNRRLEEQLSRSQKLEAIGTLVGGIAHDFNNILTPILGYAEMAITSLDESDSLYDDMKSIKRGSERAKELIDQIMTFSRQNGKDRKQQQMQSIVEEAVKLLRPSIPSTIEIYQQLDSSCKNVLADPTQIHQVVMNLCINAFQAMEKKGGKLTLELEEFMIDSDKAKLYPHLEEKEYVRFSVSDTGIGMSKSTMDRIFEPFFTTKETGKGTGMGLSVVHGIVRSHGGDVIVYSELQKGSVFHVYLPVVVEENKVTEEKVITIPKGEESILVVDDEEIIAKMIKTMLERLGYSVAINSSSKKALEMFKNQPEIFDLVLSDLTMPQMTGVELAEALHKVKPKLPIVIMTGYGNKLSPDIQKHFGIGQVIGKPILFKDLSVAIRNVLDKKNNC